MSEFPPPEHMTKAGKLRYAEMAAAKLHERPLIYAEATLLHAFQTPLGKRETPDLMLKELDDEKAKILAEEMRLNERRAEITIIERVLSRLRGTYAKPQLPGRGWLAPRKTISK